MLHHNCYSVILNPLSIFAWMWKLCLLGCFIFKPREMADNAFDVDCCAWKLFFEWRSKSTIYLTNFSIWLLTFSLQTFPQVLLVKFVIGNGDQGESIYWKINRDFPEMISFSFCWQKCGEMTLWILVAWHHFGISIMVSNTGH